MNDYFTKLKEKVDSKISDLEVPDELKENVAVDVRNLRLFLDHNTVAKAVDYLSSLSEDNVIRSVEPNNGFYQCGITFADEEIEVRSSLDSIRSAREGYWCDFSTPDGMFIKDRPILTFFARYFLGLFGNTWLGELVLSRKISGSIRWNGKQGQILFPKANLPKSFPASKIDIVIRVDFEPRGIWMSFDGGATVGWFFGRILMFILMQLKGVRESYDE